MTDIRTVTVIGANGTMGANVAGIFASFGNAKVYCVGRDIEKVKRTIPRIVKSVRADSISHNLVPADFSMLEKCVAESDLVFESTAENLKVKTDVAKIVAENLRAEAFSCTGTSGLSVTKLAECYPESLRKRFFGVHMFNPPYSMSLCEFISTKYSDPEAAGALKEYLTGRLIRTVVDVKDSPAFLANRIGFQLINEAMQYAEWYQDNGGIDYIDAILGTFTGRTMAPLTTSDFVGLDVHKAIVDNLYENTDDYAHESFVLPDYAVKLIEAGSLGRKSNGGLYKLVKYDNGLRRMTVFDIGSGMYRDVLPYTFPFADKMKRMLAEGDYEEAFSHLVNNHSQEAEICLSFLLKYILYSVFCAKEVAYTIEAADDVMAAGFNWCPPLAMYDALSAVTDVAACTKELLPDICKAVDVDELLSEIKPSKYDYRRYFKSGRKA